MLKQQQEQTPQNQCQSLKRQIEELRQQADYVKMKKVEEQCSEKQSKISYLASQIQDANLQIWEITQEMNDKQKQIQYLKKNLKLKQNLEKKTTSLESDYEDLKQFEQKLNRQIKLQQEEEKIEKGRLIILHNKINETKQEIQLQLAQKQHLQKHSQQISKGIRELNRKTKLIIEQINHERKTIRPMLKMQDLTIQIEIIEKEIQNQKIKIEQLIELNSLFSQQEEYSESPSKLLKENQDICIQNERIIRQNLLKQQQQLTERIKFLKKIETEDIHQKKLYLQGLKQKKELVQSQRQLYVEEIKQKQAKIHKIQSTQIRKQKKGGKKGKKSKLKPIKQNFIEVQENKIQNQQSSQGESNQKNLLARFFRKFFHKKHWPHYVAIIALILIFLELFANSFLFLI